MVMIDADAHVLETEKTWEYMEDCERQFRPQIVAPSPLGISWEVF